MSKLNEIKKCRLDILYKMEPLSYTLISVVRMSTAVLYWHLPHPGTNSCPWWIFSGFASKSDQWWATRTLTENAQIRSLLKILSFLWQNDVTVLYYYLFSLYLFAILPHLQKTITLNRIQVNWSYLLETFHFPFRLYMFLSRHLLGFPVKFGRKDLLIWEKGIGTRSEKTVMCCVYSFSFA